jgi:hypothetical protein
MPLYALRDGACHFSLRPNYAPHHIGRRLHDIVRIKSLRDLKSRVFNAGTAFALPVSTLLKEEVLSMNRYMLAFLAMILASGVATSALAQENPADVIAVVEDGNTTIVFERGTQNLNLAELRAFDNAAKLNPDMTRALARKPALIGSGRFVGKYAALQEFLDRYPDARENIRRNPGNYVAPVAGSSWAHAAPGLKNVGTLGHGKRTKYTEAMEDHADAAR